MSLTVNRTAAVKCALALDGYIRRRAHTEGGRYELHPNLYLACIESGIRMFFGVEVDEDGHLIYDHQEPYPGFLADYNLRYAQAEAIA